MKNENFNNKIFQIFYKKIKNNKNLFIKKNSLINICYTEKQLQKKSKKSKKTQIF